MNKNTASLAGAVRIKLCLVLDSMPAHRCNRKLLRRCVPQRIYVTLFPCNECAKLMIQAGIVEVVYHEVSAATHDVAGRMTSVMSSTRHASLLDGAASECLGMPCAG